MTSMNTLIGGLRMLQDTAAETNFTSDAEDFGSAARRLEECRAFFERFAAGEPPPENTTYEQWARELLA